MSGEFAIVEGTIDGPSEATSALAVGKGDAVGISVAGNLVGTAQLQRSFKGEAGPWRKVKDYTEPAEDTYVADARCLLRFQVTAYTSGGAEVLLAKG